MIICIGILIALTTAWFGGSFIKKHAKPIYIASAATSIAVSIIMAYGIDAGFPGIIAAWIWPLLSKCALATGIFVVVMFIGALPNGSVPMKRLMPVRAELSIIASILTLGHNAGYGRSYFVRLFTSCGSMPLPQIAAAICSLVMIGIMLPLFITSFPAVRRKMKPRSWKKLQRTAYVFYGLIYVHVMLLNVPLWQKGNAASLANIIIYSLIFFAYAAFRLRKALMRKRPQLVLPAMLLCAAVMLAVAVPFCIPHDGNDTVAEVPGEPVTYRDGSYFGTGSGFNGEITLAVRITDGSIASITVVSHSEDSSYFDKALGVLDSIVETQSIEVDAVSGATYTSDGLKEAVSEALAGAAATE